MSQDIESNLIEDYWNEEKHCRHCESFTDNGETGYCRELEQEIASDSHCDFFQSKD